jgi:DNA-binding CsgD family transcriptional regulator
MQKLVKRWRGPQLPVAIITCLKPGIHRLGVINLRVKQLENELLLCEALEPRNRTELSKRQREIAKLYAKGLTRIEISNKLGITQNTVVSHLDKIFERLEINNKARLAGLMLGK